MAAKKIPKGAVLVGPIAGIARPVRAGLYLRISPKTKQQVWSYWNGRTWGKYTDDMNKAPRMSQSRHQNLPWFGVPKAA